MNCLYYILSNLHTHALAVLAETETAVTIQKLTTIQRLDEFTNGMVTEIVADGAYLPRTEEKDELSRVFEDVEITKEYWRVYEYLTGIKRKAVRIN